MTAEQTERAVERSSELPAGSITFVLTDVEGSTRLWEEHPDTMSKALVDHDSVVDETIERFGGVRVKGRSEGDSTFSVFADPVDALAGGLALQRALPPWPKLPAALPNPAEPNGVCASPEKRRHLRAPPRWLCAR